MAESNPLGKTLTKGSDMFPDIYCDPCHDMEGHILQAVGFCENCSENLCQNCILAHKKNKLTRNHLIQNQTGVPPTQSMKGKKHATVKCHQHEEEELRSYCRSCDQLCCKICQTIDHQFCQMQSLTNAAANIKDSHQLKDLEKKLKALKKGYMDNLIKAENQSLNIEKFYTDAINDIKKLQEKFEKLFAATVKEAVTLRDEDLKMIEYTSLTSSIVVEQINKMSSNLDQMQINAIDEPLFISMKRAESHLNSFEDRLNQLDIDNIIQQYKFEPDKKLNAMLHELKALGELSISNNTSSAQMQKTAVAPATMLKTPVFIKDIDIQSQNIRGSILLPNQRLLFTEHDCKVKLIDTKLGKTVSELHLPHSLWDITQISVDEIAIACYNAKKILFVSLISNKLTIERGMPVDGRCFGLEYNHQQNNLIVTMDNPPKIEILSLNGTVMRRFDKDANESLLFESPRYVALSNDQTKIYITDISRESVTLMTLYGDVKAVYKDNMLHNARGVCVNRFGIVYVVGCRSHSVHQIVPGSDKFEPLLDQNNGLKTPWTVVYCDAEDKLYVGQNKNCTLKIFKMK